MRAFIRSKVACEADVDDLHQEVFLRVQENIDSLRRSDRLQSWLFQIARRAVADFYRRRALRPLEAVEAVVGLPDGDADDGHQNRAVASWLATMIEVLPAKLRDAVRMYEIEEAPQAEIASRLGISLSGAKSRVQRGRRQLEAMLRDHCNVQLDRRGNVIACEPATLGKCGGRACECEA